MDFQELNAYMAQHEKLDPQSEAFASMARYAFEAEKILGELNTGYHSPQEVYLLFEKLSGKPVPKGVRIALPFYSDYGKNITLSEGVFINACCQFQDQGGITIGKDTLIGPKVVIATINHGLAADKRKELYLQGVTIGKNVWVGASAVILPGVTIGDNSVIAAGAVVNKDVPSDCVAGGVPARILKTLE